MHRAHHRWWSQSLHREMELLEFGHGGAKIIAFPTSGGRFWEWEDRGMVAAVRHQLEQGWFQMYLVDTVDSESWYADHAHPGAKVWRQVQYDAYLRDELLPFMNWRNGHPFVVTTGASFGAYHALSFGLRHPDRVQRILSMSGLCDIKRFTRGFYNDLVYFHNPVDFIPGESDGYRLHHLRQQDIILAVGKDDGLLHQNRELSGKLWDKGVGNALREWDGFAHDWPVWYKMLNLYVGGHD
jgi:esterase/lipase superfamily enzyme